MVEFQMYRRSARKRTPSTRLSQQAVSSAKSARQMLRSTKPAEDGPITQDQSIITCSAAPSTSNLIAATCSNSGPSSHNQIHVQQDQQLLVQLLAVAWDPSILHQLLQVQILI